ncbi:MAG: ring-cleaving dioxygenase, partial [Candidatus Eisenbacteria bacterium]|nr:ring-cleaving dioxygenase [Candidatus Eisenbacteria bacterium]
ATPGAVVDVSCAPELRAGRIAVGRVHHIAFRCADDAEQLAWRERLTHAGLDVTPVMDRQYFHSIYFREPGGVLFELATDAPGFATDEAADRLGASLRLPAWLETRRARIEAALPPLRLPPIASS